MDTTSIAIIVAWFVGAFISGFTGIGAALIAVPILSFFLPMRENVLLSCLLVFAIVIVMFLEHRRYARPLSGLRLLVGVIPGTVVGILCLDHMPVWLLQVALGTVIMFFLVWQIFGGRLRGGKESWPLGFVAGGVGAMLGTALATDGPPVAAYGIYVGWQPRVYLGTLSIFFITRGVCSIFAQAGCGMYTGQIFHYFCFGLPAVILGTLLALPVVKRVDPARFRSIVLFFIGLSGAACFIKAALG